jgi:quinol monooxygenase YgiN
MQQIASDANTFHLYEVYVNQDAHLTAHRNSPHYTKWRETVQDWFDGEPQRFTMNTIFPSDEGWRKQKPHLLNW